MPIYISLLRGINVGGNKKIKMASLRELYGELGFEHTRSVLASGNVVFKSDQTDQAAIIQQIEAAIIESYGFESKIILRTAQEIITVSQKNPFADADPKKALAIFLDNVPEAGLFEELKQGYDGIEDMRQLQDREVVINYPEGMGRSKLTHATIEKALKVTGTGRNWNTVNRLLTLIDEVKA